MNCRVLGKKVWQEVVTRTDQLLNEVYNRFLVCNRVKDVALKLHNYAGS